MAARPRTRKHANWPANLNEPRPGYFTWRNPIDKKLHILGRVTLAQAIHESAEANVIAEQSIVTKTLAERLEESGKTVADLILRVSTDGLMPNTIKSNRSSDNPIKQKFGTRPCKSVTTEEISNFLDEIKKRGAMRRAQAVRARLVDIFATGVAIGWLEKNMADVTLPIKAPVKRLRLTLEQFHLILAKAPEVADWLPNAMLLALVSGQDRSTIGTWERAWTKDGEATVLRPKKKKWIAIPTEIRMDAIGLSLADVIAQCRKSQVVSKYLIHHTKNKGAAKRGDPIRLQTITDAFGDARELAGIPAENGPTFHEIRSLSKRTYDEEGRVDTKALLGHSTDATANLYADNRGIAPIKVRIHAA